MLAFKLPDFAPVIGKQGFADADYLVDDAARNVRRFVSSGRRGVYAEGSAPAIAFSKLRNMAWTRPRAALKASMTSTAELIVQALRELIDARPGSSRHVAGQLAKPADLAEPFTIEIPNEAIRTEWLHPLRTLRQELTLADKT